MTYREFFLSLVLRMKSNQHNIMKNLVANASAHDLLFKILDIAQDLLTISEVILTLHCMKSIPWFENPRLDS